jgi:hypothetical protein
VSFTKQPQKSQVDVKEINRLFDWPVDVELSGFVKKLKTKDRLLKILSFFYTGKTHSKIIAHRIDETVGNVTSK